MQTNELKELIAIREALGGSSGSTGTPQTPVNGTVTTTASFIAYGNENRTAIFIHNHGEVAIKVNFNAVAGLKSAIYQIPPGLTLVEDTILASSGVSAIAEGFGAETANYTLIEVLR